MNTTIDNMMREVEELIANSQFSEVENVWLEAVGSGIDDVQPYISLAAKMSKAGHKAKAASLLELLVDPLVKAGNADAACRVVSAASEHDPGSSSLRESARKAYGAVFSGVEGFEEVVKQAETEAGIDPAAFVRRLRELCSFRVGDYLFHDAGWGLGKVVSLDLVHRKLSVDFSGDPGHEVDLTAATKFFRKLPKDHLLCRKAEDTGGCQAQAKTDPVGLVRCAMRSIDGKVTLKRLKEALSPDIIAKSSWSKWWADARKSLGTGGHIRIGSGSNPTLELLHVPVTMEEEYSAELTACHTSPDFAAVLRRYLRESDESSARAAWLTTQLQMLFNRIADKNGAGDHEKLLAKFLLEEARDVEDGITLTYELDVNALCANEERILKALPGLAIVDYERKALDIVREVNPHWQETYAKALLTLLPNTWDYIVERLRDAERADLVYASARTIYDRAASYPLQILWLARRVIVDELPADYGLKVNRCMALGEVLRLGMDIFHQMERGKRSARELLHKFRAALSERNNRMAQIAIEEADEDQARHLLHKILSNRALSETHTDNLVAIVAARFPELRAVEAVKADAEDEDVGTIFTTTSGVSRKRRELDDLLNLEMPKVQKAIGEALALGDISENAELDVARAKEDQLKQQAARLAHDLERAKVFKPADVNASVAGFGTKVSVRNTETGEQESYTILGRWEADAERGIISDISAVGRGLTGLKVGQTATFKTPSGQMVTYELLKLERAEFAGE